MKIGIVTECYRPVINGVVFSILNFKDALESRGHEVFVFTPATGNENGERGLIACRSIGHPAYPGYGLTLPLTRSQRAVAATLDVIHVHHPFVMGRHALTMARGHNKPLVFTNHTQYTRYSHYIPLVGGMLRGALESYVTGFIHQCDLIVAPSEGISRYLRAQQVTRPISVVPNGIATAKFTDLKLDRRGAKKWLGLEPDTTVVLYSGRIALEKNLDFLLDSFKGLLGKTAGSKINLVVAGSGPQEENFRKMVTARGLDEDVVMLGAIAYDEMPKVYRAADLFATASTTEVHPLTIMEALASGLPVVAVTAMGTGDIVTDGEDGLLTEETLEDFTSALARLLGDTALRERMARNARAGAARFGVERSTTTLLAAYELAIAEHARRSNSVSAAAAR
ncbi:MAG: glycosyltransferase [Actinobacteria bacterium]|nr:glycosyltransferase [Actinomycetota bacterium]